MIRAIRTTAAVLAAAALVSLPTTAIAADYDGPKVIVNNVDQFALGDIFNAGHDNTVGSDNGGQAEGQPGVGLPEPGLAHLGITTKDLPLPTSTISLSAKGGDATFPYELLASTTATADLGDGPSAAIYISVGSSGRVDGQVRIDADVENGVIQDATCDAGGNLQCTADPQSGVVIEAR